MHKTATINTRIEPKLKKNAEQILHKIGLTNAEAIRLFYTQICLRHGLPFDIKIPNKTTLSAISQSESRQTISANNLSELFSGLE